MILDVISMVAWVVFTWIHVMIMDRNDLHVHELEDFIFSYVHNMGDLPAEDGVVHMVWHYLRTSNFERSGLVTFLFGNYFYTGNFEDDMAYLEGIWYL